MALERADTLNQVSKVATVDSEKRRGPEKKERREKNRNDPNRSAGAEMIRLSAGQCLPRYTSSIILRDLRSRGARPLRTSQWPADSGEFQPLSPPPPSSLPKPAPPKYYRRTRKWIRRLLYSAAAVGFIYSLDNRFYDSCLTRSARTWGVGLLVAVDYKINFRANPPLAQSIAALHARSAERLFNLLCANGGLYLKMGQAIAMQSAILPPQFQKMFAKMFDDAPQNSWAAVEQVIWEDFGKSPEEVFGVSFTGDPNCGVMERTARASASIAQVHWARLPDGREVAIKVQKREIARQVEWDLWSFK